MRHILHKGFAGGESGFYPCPIDYSCRFNDDDSPLLSRTPAGAGNRRIFSLSVWFKRCSLSLGALFNASNNADYVYFDASNKLRVMFANGTVDYLTSRVFRDVTNWYHLLVVLNTTEGTASDRLRIFLNGFQVTSFDTQTPPGSYAEYSINSAVIHRIGRSESGLPFDGYVAEYHFIDGTALLPSDFGEFKYKTWVPKKYTGGYGTNGFYLDFADTGGAYGLGADVSGRVNHWTHSGLTTDDQKTDTPTNNHCTMNSVDTGATLSDGNLRCNVGSGSISRATWSMPLTGKWYWEQKVETELYPQFGIARQNAQGSGNYANVYGLYNSDGDTYLQYLNAYTAGYLPNNYFAAGDYVLHAFDADAGKYWIGRRDASNGDAVNWITGDPSAGTSPLFGPGSSSPAVTMDLSLPLYPFVSSAGSEQHLFGFSETDFVEIPPTGFKALCSENLPEPALLNPAEGFDINLRTGTGAEATITGIEFDVSAGALVWTKSRSSAYSHRATDTIRGATKSLYQDTTDQETTESQALISFTTDGCVYGTLAPINYNGTTFVDWFFRIGAAYGFDIVTYTGTGVAHAINHNLGDVPELIIPKALNKTDAWRVFHHHALNKTDPETDAGVLNTAEAWADADTRWNDTAPTATQFTVGTDAAVNGSGYDYVAYLFRSIEGFSKVFSYTGNGNADGPFVELGFRPRWWLIKDAGSGSYSWYMYDSERRIYNPNQTVVHADTSQAEYTDTGNQFDILSNGLKQRGTGLATNTNGHLFVGIAFAEMPFKYSNAA